MKKRRYKSSGISLVFGAIIIVITMALHPSGGSIDHLSRISKLIIVTHGLAIFSLPFIYFGFEGLSMKIMDNWCISKFAFTILRFGLMAIMLAAVINGLVLPNFLAASTTSISGNQTTINFILEYGFALNEALDYVFIVSCCLAIGIFSILIIKNGHLPLWLGLFGVLMVISALVGGLTGVAYTSLIGFRIITFGLASWMVLVGIILTKTRCENEQGIYS